MISDCIDEAKLDYKYWKKEPDIDKPDNFSHRNWVSREEMVFTYFNSMKNIRGVLLVYVIRKTPYPSGIDINRKQEIIQNSPLQGNMFSRDTKNVLVILKDITVDTAD